MIKLTIDEREVNDQGMGNFYYLRAEVTEGGFAGWSKFCVAERDLIAFHSDLQHFSKAMNGTPELRAGWGQDIYFQLRCEKWKLSGTFWVTGEVAWKVNARVDTNPLCSHRLSFGFPMELGQLDSTMEQLKRLCNNNGSEVIFTGKKETPNQAL